MDDEGTYDDGYREGYADGENDAYWDRHRVEEDGYEAGKEDGAREFVDALDIGRITTVLWEARDNWWPNRQMGLQRMLAEEIKTYLEDLVR